MELRRPSFAQAVQNVGHVMNCMPKYQLLDIKSVSRPMATMRIRGDGG